MPLSKIQAESMNLADNYAFTGTVSGASGLVKLNTTDITSATATLSFDNTLITDTYDKYILSYQGLKCVTDAVYFRARFSTDNGSSFETGTFSYGYHYTTLGSASSVGSGSTKSNYTLTDYAMGNDANYPYNGTFHIDALRDSLSSFIAPYQEKLNMDNDVAVQQATQAFLDAGIITHDGTNLVFNKPRTY